MWVAARGPRPQVGDPKRPSTAAETVGFDRSVVGTGLSVLLIASSLSGAITLAGLSQPGGLSGSTDGASTATPDPTMQHGYSREAVEDEFLHLLNAERSDRGLGDALRTDGTHRNGPDPQREYG